MAAPLHDAPRMKRLVPLLLLSACADPSIDEGAAGGAGGKADDGNLPALIFGDDFTEAQTGPLAAGGQARLRYDLDRLPGCRGTQGGVPQWNISAMVSVDGGDFRAYEVTEVRGSDRVTKDAIIDVGHGQGVELYFYVSNRWGCIAYDSNEGANYWFEVEPAGEATTLTFAADWQTYVDGPLTAGADILVDYDLSRIEDCDTSGAQTWLVYRFDDGETSSAQLRDGETVRIQTPARKGTLLELWFEKADQYGCRAYDSAFGENYWFELE